MKLILYSSRNLFVVRDPSGQLLLGCNTSATPIELNGFPEEQYLDILRVKVGYWRALNAAGENPEVNLNTFPGLSLYRLGDEVVACAAGDVPPGARRI